MADFILITSIDSAGRPVSGHMTFMKPIAHDRSNGPIEPGDHVEVDNDLSTDDEVRYIRVGDFA
jgi:hypothetical protein